MTPTDTIEAVSGHTPGPYWVSTRPDGSHDVCGRNGKVIRTYPAHQMTLAGADAVRMQKGFTASEKRIRDGAPDLLEALEAQESASLFAAEVSLITPDGETVAKHLMDKADNLFSRAKRLRVAAIARARGEAQ